MPAPPPPEERIGFAAVALGRLSLDNRLAFSGSKKARLFTGSDGTHVGTVDQIYGERIKLTKTTESVASIVGSSTATVSS